jgi:hypothetical protein
VALDVIYTGTRTFGFTTLRKIDTTTLLAVITNITDNPIANAFVTVEVTANAGHKLKARRNMGF